MQKNIEIINLLNSVGVEVLPTLLSKGNLEGIFLLSINLKKSIHYTLMACSDKHISLLLNIKGTYIEFNRIELVDDNNVNKGLIIQAILNNKDYFSKDILSDLVSVANIENLSDQKKPNYFSFSIFKRNLKNEVFGQKGLVVRKNKSGNDFSVAKLNPLNKSKYLWVVQMSLDALIDDSVPFVKNVKIYDGKTPLYSIFNQNVNIQDFLDFYKNYVRTGV